MPNYVGGSGPFLAKLMIVGEAPGREENEAGRPFVGPSGYMLDEMLLKAGIHREECYITNVVKFQPPYNDLTKLHLIGVDLQQSIRELWDKEIAAIKPNCILAVGDTALNALTNYDGIMKYRGSILKARDGVLKVVPTIHMAALFNRGPNVPGLPFVWKKIIQSDINRAVEECRTKDIDLPVRQLDIAHNSLEVFRFFREYEKLGKAANDIESINCVPVCTGFAFSRHHALSIPLLTKIGPVALTDMSYRELAECWMIVQKEFFRLGIIGQNYYYDEYKQSLLGFKIPNVVSDILLKARLIFPELPSKKLNVLSSLWTREPFYKDEGTEQKVGKRFNVEQFFKYNAKDCAVSFEVDEEMETDLIGLQEQFKLPLVDFFYNYVMKKHKLYYKMQDRGFITDRIKQREMKIEYEQLKETTHKALIESVGHEVNVKSYPGIYELLYKELKFPTRKREPTSEDSIVALLGNHCKGKDATLKRTILEGILTERRIRDQLSRAINFEPDFDGRCKSTYNIESTETARSSTGILQKPLRPDKRGLAWHTIPKHGKFAKGIMSMLICDPGMVIIQLDASQAESRVVAVLSEDWELLRAFDTVDVHRRTAGLLFGLTKSLNLSIGDIGIVDHLEKDGPERFTGKTFRHAGAYDMQKRTAMLDFNTKAQKFEVNMEISEWKAGNFLELFHAASPKIRGKFHADIRAALNSFGYLINPFGRPRVFNGRPDEDRDKEGYAHIPQSTVADLVQGAALLADEEFGGDTQFFWCGEKHDSLTIQCPANNWEPYAKVLKKHMERPIDFSTYCTLKRDVKLVIPADVEFSDTNYAEMRKVKLT
jgi:uracil-DNA glycosylase family 4